MARTQVDDGRRNEKRRDFSLAAFKKRVVLALNDVEAADAGADVNPDLLRVLLCNHQPGVEHRLVRRGQRKMGEAAHLLRFLLVDEV